MHKDDQLDGLKLNNNSALSRSGPRRNTYKRNAFFVMLRGHFLFFVNLCLISYIGMVNVEVEKDEDWLYWRW